MKFSRVASAVSTSLLLSATIANNAAAEASPDEELKIERIIVTGQKISRTLQETTTSVAVVTAQDIKQQNITNFNNVLAVTANAHSTPGSGFSIRGIDGANVSGGGNSYLASVYVDGAALPKQMINAGSFSTWDANQVEVLRGPQSTLQGRNALAGAVVMNTQVPTYDWQGIYRLQVGEYGEKEAAIAFGGGIIEDQLAFRFSGEHKQDDGFVKNLTLNKPSNERKDQLYRLKFLLTPEAMPDFTALLTYTHAENERGMRRSSNPINDDPTNSNPYNQVYVYNNIDSKLSFDADLLSLKLDYLLNDEWDLTTVTTYSAVNDNSFRDSDDSSKKDGPKDGGSNTWSSDTDTFSQELRLTFNYEKLQGIVGAYYFNENIKNSNIGRSNIPLAKVGLNSTLLIDKFGLDAGTAGLALAQYDAFNPAKYESTSETITEVTSYALFTDFVYKVTDQLDIYAGIRFDREEQKNAENAKVALTNIHLLPNPANYQGTPYQGLIPLISGINSLIHNTVNNANGSIPLVDASFDTVLPKIGVSYHWSEDLTTSFTFQQGYRSGGVGTNTATAKPYQYDPEYTNNYEFSLRSSWLDGALIANANIFYVDWSKQQVNVQLSGNIYDKETRNAGSSTVKGFELELNYQVNNQLKLYSSLGQAKSEFTQFLLEIPRGTSGAESNGANTQTDNYDLSGRSFADSPEWTGNIGAIYNADNGFFANVSANYASSSPGFNNPYVRVYESDGLFKRYESDHPYYDPQNHSRTLVNMQLGYEWDTIGVYLLANNIFDKQFLEFNDHKIITIGDARQFSLSVRGSF